MSAIGGLLGLGGGAAGTNFSGPQTANLTAPTNSTQVNQAYNGTQGALTSQQQLLAALQGQNGLANQSQVYNQLQGVASGAVNPAQAQFNQNTGANVAAQAALQAGQRGASSNVGLIARQAAQQGAATQQQAVGQEATQQATNQINAIGQAGQVAGTQVANQIGATTANTQAQQNEQQQLLSALQGYNTNQVASQASVNAGNAALAGTQMQGQQGLIGGVINGAGAAMGGARGGKIPNFDDGGDVQLAPYPAAAPKSGGGGGGSSAAALLPLLMAAAGGGDVSLGVNTTLPAASVPAPAPATTAAGPSSAFGQFLKGWGNGGNGSQASSDGSKTNSTTPQTGPGALQQGSSSLTQGIVNQIKGPSGQNVTMPDGSVAGNSNNYGAQTLQSPDMGSSFSAAPAAPSLGLDFAKGGKVKAMVSPGEKYLTPEAVKKVKNGANPMKVGETIPGKPKVPGAKNSYANDTVKKDLKAGGIIVPRSETKSKDPDRNSRDFVQKVLAKRQVRK